MSEKDTIYSQEELSLHFKLLNGKGVMLSQVRQEAEATREFVQEALDSGDAVGQYTLDISEGQHDLVIFPTAK
ncbi:hypothetical protein M1349_04390 [Patescibacteria group bacterium]|nr:hypothetical protein [Patescibacteria group bacterium]